MTSAHYRIVCVQCRTVDQAHLCRHPKIRVSPKWRPPRKEDDVAWKDVAEGNLLWDDRAVERTATRERKKREKEEKRLRDRRVAARLAESELI